MKLPVTESGVTLPKVWFGDATEVEVRQENGHVTIEPLAPRAASGADFEAELEQLLFDGPSLPPDFSRADIYADHD